MERCVRIYKAKGLNIYFGDTAFLDVFKSFFAGFTVLVTNQLKKSIDDYSNSPAVNFTVPFKDTGGPPFVRYPTHADLILRVQRLF